MKCPTCGELLMKVLHSDAYGDFRIRFRQCEQSHRVMRTEERQQGYCSKCGSDANTVYKSVLLEDELMRIRECEHCGHRWRTKEQVLAGETEARK